MKMLPPSRNLFALAGACLITLSSVQAQTLLYSDSFDGANGTIVRGNTPTINLTGATYLGASRGSAQVSYDTSAGNPAGSAITNFNGSAALSLASGGSYIRGAIFTLSADLSVGTLGGSGTILDPQVNGVGSGNSTRGVGLGFYSNFGNGTGQDPFSTLYTGFNLQNAGTSNAILQFVKNGVSTGFTSLSVLTGTLNTAAFYNLSYTVDTTTGNLMSLSFNGVDLTSSFTATTAGAFTTANTAFAGFGGSSSVGGAATGRIDNFSVVSAVPEPTTVALLIGAGLMFGILRRHRVQRA